MSNTDDTHEEAPAGVVDRAVSPQHGGATTQGRGEKPVHDVEVHVDYISADEPIQGKFAPDTVIGAIKDWARQQFVPNPPSNKAYYLNDDKTRHRFTEEEERQTLAQLGYEHSAHFRLNEEQASGA